MLKTFGQIAGIGGLSLGVLLIVFRNIIQKNIFPRLPPVEAYRLLQLMVGGVWSIAVLGILAWVYTSQSSRTVRADNGSVAIDGSANGATIVNRGR